MRQYAYISFAWWKVLPTIMSVDDGSLKIRQGLTVIALCVVALVIMSDMEGHPHYRLAGLPYVAAIYGSWMVVSGLWMQLSRIREEESTEQLSAGRRQGVNLRQGFTRLGVSLSLLWLAVIAGAVLIEYYSLDPDCMTFWSDDARCRAFFFSYVPTLALNVNRVLLLALGPLIVGVLLGLASAWIVRGFRGA